MTYCACCETEYTPYDDMRFWSGDFVARESAEAPAGTALKQICERCKRNGDAKRVS